MRNGVWNIVRCRIGQVASLLEGRFGERLLAFGHTFRRIKRRFFAAIGPPNRVAPMRVIRQNDPAWLEDASNLGNRSREIGKMMQDAAQKRQRQTSRPGIRALGLRPSSVGTGAIMSSNAKIPNASSRLRKRVGDYGKRTRQRSSQVGGSLASFRDGVATLA